MNILLKMVSVSKIRDDLCIIRTSGNGGVGDEHKYLAGSSNVSSGDENDGKQICSK